MNSSLQGKRLMLLGVLDEHSDMDAVANLIEEYDKANPGQPIQVDFSEVDRANSCGIFEWLKVVLHSKASMHYVNTPVWLILQMNMNDEFLLENNLVSSLIAPFYSQEEDRNQEITLTVGKDVPILSSYEDYRFPDVTIQGVIFEPDFDPEDFFDFIARNYSKYQKDAA